jgi:acyl-CoA reductase-like NAD-dependent aldehyde dehydrogenase
VVANISAWNYPWFVGCNVIVPALLTGNAVLYKPSEHATLTGQHITRLLHEAGVPREVMVCLVGAGEVGARCSRSHRRRVLHRQPCHRAAHRAGAGAALVKLQLELGGKDPTYVRADADPKAAAESLADGAMYNTGQSCCSVERIYVHEKVHDAFVAALPRHVRGFTGRPDGPRTPTSARSRVRRSWMSRRAGGATPLAKGAQLLCRRPTRLRPAVVPATGTSPRCWPTSTTAWSSCARRASAPSSASRRSAAMHEAVKLMNDTRYGLTAGVYTPDEERARGCWHRSMPAASTGTAATASAPGCPGAATAIRASGLTLSTYGIQTFTRPKAWHLKSAG